VVTRSTAHGEGSIRKLKSGRYQFRCVVGGKQVNPFGMTFETEEACLDAVERLTIGESLCQL